VRSTTVWLKMLNLALMGGAPQHILFISYLFFKFELFLFLVVILVFCFSGTNVFAFKFGGVL
jgi:hypothetical protein